MPRLPFLGPRQRKRFRVEPLVRALGVKPKTSLRKYTQAVEAFPNWGALMDAVEQEVRMYGQVRPQPELDRHPNTRFGMAIRAYGGSDFIRDVTRLALSTAGIGRTRKESDEVLVNDLHKVTRGRPGLSTEKMRLLPGGSGIIQSAHNRGGIYVARALAGVPEGKRYGARSLTVNANFGARVNEMAN